MFRAFTFRKIMSQSMLQRLDYIFIRKQSLKPRNTLKHTKPSLLHRSTHIWKRATTFHGPPLCDETLRCIFHQQERGTCSTSFWWNASCRLFVFLNVIGWKMQATRKSLLAVLSVSWCTIHKCVHITFRCILESTSLLHATDAIW